MAFSLNNSNAFYNFSLPTISYPFSMAGWFRVPDVSSFISFMGVGSFTGGTRCDIYYAGDGGKEAVAKSVNGASGSAYSTNPMIPGQWHHLAAVFPSDAERRIYLDGSSVGVDNESVPIGTVNLFYFGSGYSTTSVDVAEISLVSTALGDEEIATLAKGYPLPALPNSSEVMAYHDCIRQENHPGWGPVFLRSSPAVVVEHPRVMFSHGGYSTAMPKRVRGPFRVEEAFFRPQSSEQGQFSSAGVISTNANLSGEVVS